MKYIDFVFLHLGSKVLDEKEKTPLIPIGTFYLADYLERNGIKTKVIDLFSLKQENKNFNIQSFLETYRIKAIGLPLHWHHQSYNIINFAKEIKKNLPHIKIILGGNTASFFMKEIIENYIYIDFIIRGDAEIPLLTLMKRILKEDVEFYNIPNLIWRQKDKIIYNKHSYKCSQKILNEIEYPNLNVLINKKHLFLEETNTILSNISGRTIIYNPARGCNGTCPYCGGGKVPQKLIYKRGSILLPRIDNALKTFIRIQKLGANSVYIAFGIPFTENFYLNLFQKIRKENISLNASLESYYLPNENFIREFHYTFPNNSKIILSPDTGSDSLRKRIKTFYYANKTLIRTLDLLCTNKINTHLQFSTGFPYETWEDFSKTIFLIKYLKKKFPLTLGGDYIELEAASPMHLYPEKFEISIKRKGFLDFLKASCKKNDLGYHTKNFSESQILFNNKLLNELYKK